MSTIISLNSHDSYLIYVRVYDDIITANMYCTIKRFYDIIKNIY